ncbi:8743_t:CDS:2 [Rhizophagus irregularis]|nr:8743_t:CDS:2 [Rhizophagus irregularis]
MIIVVLFKSELPATANQKGHNGANSLLCLESTSTLIPVYTPSEPTGPSSAHLANEEDDDELVRILKAHANLLITRGRLTVDSEILEANNQIKHIINILMQRCKAKHEELERQLIIIRAANDNFIEENHNLQRDYDTMVKLRRWAIADYTQAVRDRNEAQNAVNRDNILLNHWWLRATQTGKQLVLANTQLGQTLGRLRNRLFQQIAALRIQVQWFRIRQLNPPPLPPNNPQNTI